MKKAFEVESKEKLLLKSKFLLQGMTKPPKYWNKAKKFLSKKDKILSRLIEKYKGPAETILISRKDIFFSLCKSIIGQQISVVAANAVFLKFKKKCKNKINAKVVSKLTFIYLCVS